MLLFGEGDLRSDGLVILDRIERLEGRLGAQVSSHFPEGLHDRIGKQDTGGIEGPPTFFRRQTLRRLLVLHHQRMLGLGRLAEVSRNDPLPEPAGDLLHQRIIGKGVGRDPLRFVADVGGGLQRNDGRSRANVH